MPRPALIGSIILSICGCERFTKKKETMPLPPSPHAETQAPEEAETGMAELATKYRIPCGQESGPLVVFDKAVDSFKYCDEGRWANTGAPVSQEGLETPKKTSLMSESPKSLGDTGDGEAVDSFHCRADRKIADSFLCTRHPRVLMRRLVRANE